MPPDLWFEDEDCELWQRYSNNSFKFTKGVKETEQCGGIKSFFNTCTRNKLNTVIVYFLCDQARASSSLCTYQC